MLNEELRTAEALQALAESRARFGDMEARVVELEAVIQKVRLMCENEGDKFRPIARRLTTILDAAPSVVLADHDAAVWDQGYEAGEDDEAFIARGLDTDPGAADHPHANPYRVADQNGGE